MEIELLGLVALGFAIGTYGTIIGVGGGFVLVPILLFLYPDYDPERFTAVSLAVVWANSTSGSIAYARQRRVDVKTGLLFAVSAVPGVVAGVFIVDLIPKRPFSILFALLLGLIAIVALRPPKGIQRPLRGPGVIVRSLVTEEGTYRFGYRAWQGVALSLVVGFISSLFGIGGGALQVPGMIMLLHFPVQFAVGTSQFVLLFTSGGATLLHLVTGTLAGDQLLQAAALGGGAIPGGQVGALIARQLKARATLALLAAALVVLSARLLLKGIAGV